MPTMVVHHLITAVMYTLSTFAVSSAAHGKRELPRSFASYEPLEEAADIFSSFPYMWGVDICNVM